MARPQKTGIDYFPLDVDMDDKVKLIDAKFGVAGFGILIKLWQIIYDNGYYIEWTEKELLLYKNRINADINLINDVINECLKWGIFNAELYELYSILTSSGIQKRYFEATKRRTEVTLINELILVPLPNNYKPTLVFVNINPVNAYNNSKNADSSTQSKVKYSKVYNNNSSSSCSRAGNVFQFYQENIGLISPFQTETLNSYIDDGLKPEVIIEAMKDSLGTDNKWKYLTSILNRCIEQQIYTFEQYEAAKVEHENKKNGTPRSKPQGQIKTWTEIKEEEFERAKRLAFDKLKAEGVKEVDV
jgi:DnaD/phage-associated family protein